MRGVQWELEIAVDLHLLEIAVDLYLLEMDERNLGFFHSK